VSNQPIITEVSPGRFDVRRNAGEQPFALLVSPSARGTRHWGIFYRHFTAPHFHEESSNSHTKTRADAEYELARMSRVCNDRQLGLAA
jgi:hypothetical protein